VLAVVIPLVVIILVIVGCVLKRRKNRENIVGNVGLPAESFNIQGKN